MKKLFTIVLIINCLEISAQDSIPYAKADHIVMKDTVLCQYMIDSTGRSETGYFFRYVEGDNYWVPDADGKKATKQSNFTKIQYFRNEEEFPKHRIIQDFGILKY